jgi:hypothetical protein
MWFGVIEMSDVGFIIPILLSPLLLYVIQMFKNSFVKEFRHWILIFITLLSSAVIFNSNINSLLQILNSSSLYLVILSLIFFTLSFQHGEKFITLKHSLKLLIVVSVLISMLYFSLGNYSLLIWTFITLSISFLRKLTIYDFIGTFVELLLIMLLNYNDVLGGAELLSFIVLLMIFRVIIFLPNVFKGLMTLSEIVIRQGALIFLITLFVKKFELPVPFSEIVILMFTLSVLIQLFSILGRFAQIRAKLNAISFTPLLILFSFAEYVLWNQIFYIVVALYFLYVQVEGVAIKSKNAVWIRLFPQYFLSYLILPLPGSPLFFLMSDYLKMYQQNATVLLIIFFWVFVLTGTIVISLESRLKIEDRSLYVNPIKMLYVFAGMVIALLFLSDRYLLYKYINDIESLVPLN